MINSSAGWFGNICTKSIQVVSLPDLTAGNSAPTTAIVGVPVYFTSTISNIGTAPTANGSGFNNFFQVATAADGGGTITDLAPSSMPPLAANSSNTATSPAYTFTSAGTYSVRACADKSNRNDSGVVIESNENNNCGLWTNINLVVIPPSATADIKVNGSNGPVNISYNGPADITWASSNAASCSVTPPNWTELNASSGTHILNLTSSVTYTLSCLPSGSNSVDSVLVNVPSQPIDLNL